MDDDAPTQHYPVAATARSGLGSGQKVFGRFTLEAQIGRGGMGIVWRARDEKLDRVVALKFLPPEVAADAEAIRDLKRETTRCLELTHVNIVRVYDFLEEAGMAALAMEYVEGESLARIKAAMSGGCISVAELAPIVTQLCGALEYAHRVARVAHHDLKPANLLVTSGGVLKVTDFGIARSLTESHTRLTHQQGTTSGTVLYMSPQQIAGEKPTASDDIYAVGATLYELLTGKPPFFRGDSVTLRQQVLEREPGPLAAHRTEVGCTGAEIPPRWANTVLACLAKRPEDRPPTAADLALRLGLSLEPLTVTTVRSSLLPRTAFETGEDGRGFQTRRSLVPWLLALGTLLVGGAAIAFYFAVYRPEQARLAAEAERARQAEIALQNEQVRQAEEKRREAEEKRRLAEQEALEARRKEDAAKAQMEADRTAYAQIVTRIAGLTDTSTQPQMNQIQQAVRQYLQTAPEPYRGNVDKAWNERLTAWRAVLAAARPGSLIIETDPAGATVTLYPRGERRTSPVLFEGIKPGDVTLRIEKEGYESKEVPATVKPGVTARLAPIKLAASLGSLAVTSDPPDLYVVVEGMGRKLEGHTPFNPTSLPPGEYRVTYQKRGWHPQVKTVTVERGKTATVENVLHPVRLDIRTTPAAAQVAIDGFAVKSRVRVEDLEPREYTITATMDGYEPYSKVVNITGNLAYAIVMTEKPLPHALRRLVGATWKYDSFTTSAELTFAMSGRIVATHKSGLGGKVNDVGMADSFNEKLGVLLARFTAAPQGKPYFPGNVQIKQLDDDHLALSWNAAGTPERWVFEKEKKPAEKK